MQVKPTVTCALIRLEQIEGEDEGVYRAYIYRTSFHPRLGIDMEGQITVTSRVIRVDFDHRIIETLNTYYKF